MDTYLISFSGIMYRQKVVKISSYGRLSYRYLALQIRGFVRTVKTWVCKELGERKKTCIKAAASHATLSVFIDFLSSFTKKIILTLVQWQSKILVISKSVDKLQWFQCNMIKNVFWKLGIQNQIQTEQNITNLIEEISPKRSILFFLLTSKQKCLNKNHAIEEVINNFSKTISVIFCRVLVHVLLLLLAGFFETGYIILWSSK